MTTTTITRKVAAILLDPSLSQDDQAIKIDMLDVTGGWRAYELLTSNSSPCWFCGKGEGEPTVEFFDGSPSFYAHELCGLKRKK